MLRERTESFGKRDISTTVCDLKQGEQLSAKLNYIRHNPVADDFCDKPEKWPWMIDPFG